MKFSCELEYSTSPGKGIIQVYSSMAGIKVAKEI